MLCARRACSCLSSCASHTCSCLKKAVEYHCEFCYRWLLTIAIAAIFGYLLYYYAIDHIHRLTAPQSKLVCPEGLHLQGGNCVSDNAVIATPSLRESP